MKIEYEDCTTYSEKIAAGNLEIINILHTMFKDFECAQEYPAELEKGKAIEIQYFLDNMNELTLEGLDLFIGL